MRTNKLVFNTRLSDWESIRILAGVDGNTALRLATLYGHIEGISNGATVLFKQSTYARRSGLSRNTVFADLQKMASLGWLAVHQTGHAGTEIQCLGIPGHPAKGCSVSEQSPRIETAQPVSIVCSTSEQILLSDCADTAQPVSNTIEYSNNLNRINKNTDQNQEHISNKKKNSSKKLLTTEQVSSLLEVWNSHKPNSFAAHRTLPHKIQANLLTHIKRSGLSFDDFLERLPNILKRAKRHNFFSKKKPESGQLWTWANFIGGSSGFHDRFEIELEQACASFDNSVTRASLGNEQVEHPHYHPPAFPGDTPAPRINADTEKLEEAIEFYAGWQFDSRATFYD